MLLSRRSRSSTHSTRPVCLHGSASLDTRSPSGIHAGAFRYEAFMQLPIFPALLLKPLLFPLQQACRDKTKCIFQAKRNYILLLRVKEGHGAGERQRSESGLGNADIDVSHEGCLLSLTFMLRYSQDEMDAADFLTADFQRVNISGEDRSSLNRSCTGVYISTR